MLCGGRDKVIYHRCLLFPGLCSQIRRKSGIRLPFISKEWDQTEEKLLN